MGWAKARTTEMPALLMPTGQRPRGRRAVIVLVSLLVVGLSVTTVVFAPSLLRWMRLDAPPAGVPLVVSGPSETPAAESPAIDLSGEATPTPALTSAAPTATGTPASVRVKPTATPMPDLENEVLRQTNVARTADKCAALKMDAHLLLAARMHSADMAQNDYFGHTGLDGTGPDVRMKAAGYDISGGWAENIAAGYATPDAVMAGWMGSAGHRGNILNCALKSIGIGISLGANGWLYWTQDFGGR